MKNKLNNLRRQIDEIDEAIIILLAKRMKVVYSIGLFKKKNNLSALDKSRWKQVLKIKKEMAKKLNLNPKLVEKIWQAIHTEALKIERSL